MKNILKNIKKGIKSITLKIKNNNKLFTSIKFFTSIFIIIGVCYITFNYIPFIAKYDHFVIVTGSMEPIINIDDVVIIDSSINNDDLEIGDIIAFTTDINFDGKDEVVVHYLTSIIDTNGIKTYKTTPEISNTEDSWVLDDNDILGEQVLTIPKIGSFLRFASSTIGRIVLVVDLLVVYLLFEFIPKSKENVETDEKEI